jgi:hypothetical protein
MRTKNVYFSMLKILNKKNRGEASSLNNPYHFVIITMIGHAQTHTNRLKAIEII